MTRQALLRTFAALILVVPAFGIGGYSGYLLGRDAHFNDGLFCTAGHTRTYLRLLEDLRTNDLSMAEGLIETSIDAGVILLTSGPEKYTEDPAAFVHETLAGVRDHRKKHPWTGSSTEVREQVKRALAKVR